MSGSHWTLWITDTSVDDQGAWSYVSAAGFKSADRLVDNLVDRVSKNGNLLLGIGPKADGSIPELQADRLRSLGRWLQTNGEAIYGTRPWKVYAEGPTVLREPGPARDHTERMLRDAGIPLVMQYKTTSKGTQLPDRWALPRDQ